MGNRRTGSNQAITIQLVTATLALVVGMTASQPALAEPESSPSASPTGLPVTMPLDAGPWCKPIVNAAIDPDPLACWLHLAAEVPAMPPAMAGMNFGDQPPWNEIDSDVITEELDRYEARLEAERLEAERAEAERAVARKRESSAPASSPSGGDACGVRPGDFPTEAQLECMFGSGGGGDVGGGSDEVWSDDPDDYPPPEEFVWEPVEGYNPLPPPPDCPNGWRYDSDTGYRCL